MADGSDGDAPAPAADGSDGDSPAPTPASDGSDGDSPEPSPPSPAADGSDGDSPAPAPPDGDAPAAAAAKGRANLVFWDIEMCPIPDEYNNKAKKKIAEDLMKKLSDWGFHGPVKMLAVHVNNYVRISPETCKELSDSGIIVNHVKFDLGGEDYPSYPIVLNHLLDWMKKNPSPANVLVISVNRPFSAPYKILRDKKYNILRIRPEMMDADRDDNDYCSWRWSDILHGGRPLIASLCYDDEWTWSETFKDGKTVLAERLAEQRALRPRRDGKALSNGDDPPRSGGNGGTTFGRLYTRKNLKLLRSGVEPAGFTRRLRPRKNTESLSNEGEQQ